jgi:hypothetical protein
MSRSLDYSELSALNEVSAALGISNPDWLKKLINFETAGTFSPTIKNPNSSARGLIQFINSTSRGLGYLDSYDLVTKNPTFVTQIRGPVQDYLRPYSPFRTEQSLYLSVFYPAYRNKPLSTPFPDYVLKNNPGIRTPQDYINKIRGDADFKGVGVLLIVGVAVLFLLKNRK